MTPEERDRMYTLCARIEVEKDHEEFTRLVQELNDLLESKEDRLSPPSSGTTEPKPESA